jgi:hypothetical protein
MGKKQNKVNISPIEKLTFNEESKKKLANLVRDRECLWKISNKDYKKPDIAAKFWREVALELDIPGNYL